MPYGLRDLRRLFTGKLGFDLDASARHPTFVFRHDGRIVAKTHISHGAGKSVGEAIISAMARQLGVTGPQLRDALDCSLTGEGFAQLLLAR